MKHLRQQMVMAVFLVSIGLLVCFWGCTRNQTQHLPARQKRELANVLYNQQLYRQAIAEYEDYLKHYPLDEKEQASVAYQIATIYMDRLHDYENALAYFLRIKYLYPESSLQKDVSKKIVECLERLNRSVEAQQMVEQEAALVEEQKPASHPGDVVARIGKRTITTGDLIHEIQKLPPYLQDKVRQSRKSKLEFLKQYIVQELLYDSARRKGLDRDPEVLRDVYEAKKAIMAQKLLQQEIEAEAKLDKYTNADVELYYKANKERYAERDKNGKIVRIPPFSEVAQQVAQDFIAEKQKEAYERLVERLMQAEQVVIYEDKIPD